MCFYRPRVRKLCIHSNTFFLFGPPRCGFFRSQTLLQFPCILQLCFKCVAIKANVQGRGSDLSWCETG